MEGLLAVSFILLDLDFHIPKSKQLEYGSNLFLNKETSQPLLFSCKSDITAMHEGRNRYAQ